jgi:hypothetical protein
MLNTDLYEVNLFLIQADLNLVVLNTHEQFSFIWYFLFY